MRGQLFESPLCKFRLMPKNDTAIAGLQYRGFRDATAVVDEQRRVVRVSFSSEHPYERGGFLSEAWVEILGHAKDECDLSKLNAGAPILYNHLRGRADRLGKVERAWIEGGRGHAEIRISTRADVEDIWTDLSDDLLANVSVGYKILERKLIQENTDGPDEYRVTNWVPMEISLVDIPADHTVGVGRAFNLGPSASGIAYLPQTSEREPTAASAPNLPAGENTMTGKTTAKDQFRLEEKKRRDQILEIFDSHLTGDSEQFRVLRDACIADIDVSVDQARALLLEELGKDSTPTGVGNVQPDNSFGIDTGRAADFASDFVDGYLHRQGITKGELSREAAAIGLSSLRDVGRSILEMSGSYNVGMSPREEFSRLHSTSDFKQLLANVASKSMIEGFDNPELATHREWTTKVDVRDYKPHKSVSLSELSGGLKLVNEGGELTYTTLTDSGVDIRLARFERGIKFSREMYINDDLGGFANMSFQFANAALRLEKDIVFGQLIANPAMVDGNPLFDASHGNVGTAAELSVDSVGEAKRLMRLQQNAEKEQFLDLVPAYLIVPPHLETKAEQLVNSIYDPDGKVSSTHNPFAKKLNVVVEPRLSADSETTWYLVASPNSIHWFSRIYLDGNEMPYIEGPTEDFETSGLKFKGRHEFNAAPIMWHGAVRNAGA